MVLFNQFKMFYNFFFLLIGLSQFIPALKVGFLFTYIAPLAFVLVITIAKEEFDDVQRMRKDKPPAAPPTSQSRKCFRALKNVPFVCPVLGSSSGDTNQTR